MSGSAAALHPLIDLSPVRAFRRCLPLVAMVSLAAALPGEPASAAPITFSTGLAVSAGEIIVRGDAAELRAGSSVMSQRLTGVAAPAAVVYGLTPDWALIAAGPPFIDKSLSLTTPMGRITREGSGLGDLTFLGRYTAVQIDHPGSTFRFDPFVGVQAPTGSDDQRDRFGTLPRPLQPGSGAWDPVFGAVATYQTLGWEIDADAGAKISSEADGFRFGDVAFTDQSFQYRLWPRRLGAGTPAFLYGVVESNLSWHGAAFAGGLRAAPQGVDWFADVGLQYVTQRYVLEAAVQLPVVRGTLNGTRLKPDYAFIVGFRWNFSTPVHF